ncbi:iron-containing alcohol dehydrogenase [Cellulomonas aerilata]|uniref:Alcohol dehydrogenase n=1 Tax=Cellulomonas aerilata TaxID=515326 RepID=A0A512D8G5_9CELL|nr:iron-containing alcohol dehydrogenase [Cellulomonas aerilata]GEO32784.1 alcohol dehydrogenase [Cellulomonas aerilata]
MTEPERTPPAAGALPPLPLFGLLRAPREILLGVGQRAAVPRAVLRHGTRATVVTDPRLGADPALRDLVDGLRAAGVEVDVFDQALPEVPVDQVEEATRQARAHAADVVVGFGGGSCLDLAKVVALCLAHGGRPQDYYGENRVPGPVVPVVAVPTTAGTGSEVTPVAVLADPERTMKIGISSPHLIPAAAVCDPELTVSCPPGVSAAAGADALVHCLEAYTAVRRPPTPDLSTDRVFVGKGELTDAFALLGIRQAAAHLARACSHPDDLAARSGMMLAALAGGLAFGTAGTAAAHALQYPVGGLTHTPHGIGVGTLIPYVMAFNLPARTAELAEVGRALSSGVPGGTPAAAREGRDDGDGSDDTTRAHAAVTAVADLLASVGIPRTLDALGMPEDRLAWAAHEAMSARRLVENNPRPLDEAAALSILRAAHRGDLSPAGPVEQHDDAAHDDAVPTGARPSPSRGVA